jgi:uncharacterized OsmC-like protein
MQDDIRKVKAHIKVFWEGGIKTTSMMRGFEVVADAPKWKYGTNSAPAPGELFLTSIGACFTGTFSKCIQERGLIVDDMTTDVRGYIDHESNGKERFTKMTVDLTVFADEKHEEKLVECYEESKERCPLVNAVNFEIEISYKFQRS